MLNGKQKATLGKYWDNDVTFAFKRGLWELKRVQDKKYTWKLIRYKGYKSTEVIDSVEITADSVAVLANKLSLYKYSTKTQKIEKKRG